jgi:hypothetical protein
VGRYQLFLGAGYYDLVASAFGFAPASAHAVPVVTGTVTARNFRLTPLPTGQVRGTVEAVSGESVEATVSALGTPATTAATGGSYQLALPGGRYTLEARALGYRVVTASVTVTAGQDTFYDFVLPQRSPAVRTAPWYYQSQALLSSGLDDLAYAYDERRLKQCHRTRPR